ncbi:MAG: hypothetical protein JXB44_06990 [Calditrichaceae bacterium]|nr:hypothetical protein [Calditrichaceae bacterium]
MSNDFQTPLDYNIRKIILILAVFSSFRYRFGCDDKDNPMVRLYILNDPDSRQEEAF